MSAPATGPGAGTAAYAVADIRAAEATAMAALPEGALMLRAAHGLAGVVGDLLRARAGRLVGGRVLLLAGSGDNGGDALHAGAVLARRGVQVHALVLGDRPHPGGLAACEAAGGRVVTAPHGRYDLVVDGIVGIGGRPGLRPDAVAALGAVAGTPVVAVDVPSGVGVDDGTLAGDHVRAADTVTFGPLRVAHLVDPAAAATGRVHVVSLGPEVDAALAAGPPPVAVALTAADVAALVPRPDPVAHKYTRGVVGVRAGSATYPGAGLLAVAGASCGLAGMVRHVGAPEVLALVHRRYPEVVGAGRVQAWVVGSGGGAEAADHLAAAVADHVPVVADADALPAAWERATADPAAVGSRLVLTPHAGELAALVGVTRAEVEARPWHHVHAAVGASGAVVLLKGRRTLVAAPGLPTRVTTSGTPWLATAGAGDVLAGVIGALLAAGLAPADAAAVGSWWHGVAATRAARRGPIRALDVAEHLPSSLAAVLPDWRP
ncbi:bifunctional ADP-dependent NAD(P)H-hydrate dehydratase/NAD(P)H-hydrate epimerase [Nocardioides sp.]|uniref:bifunctional ADP-dependent NAD(P)H-hydrate dehydratase/NAD(P)H-hydrate epimerase n=1 Tax=Nocardioides sp. TaxID=35761 RepID=UPI0035158DDB